MQAPEKSLLLSCIRILTSSNRCPVFVEMVEDDNHLYHSLLVNFIPLKIIAFVLLVFPFFIFYFISGLLHDLCVAVFLKELFMGSRFLLSV